MRDWRAVFALFYFSGVAGLIYQVLWLRRLSLIFGVTVYAASTVLAAFMTGLALGSLLSGWVLRRRYSPLVAFGVAEVLVGVTGMASPFLLDAAAFIYAGLHQFAPDSLGALTVARLLSSFLILAVPTAMMGMTLPLLSAALDVPGRSSGSSVSLLYAVNTIGAVSGTLLTGLILIPAIGIQRAFLLAAVTNVLVGIAALWLARRASALPLSPTPTLPVAAASTAPPPLPRALATVVMVSGFASLGLEIVWFRLMLQFVTATSEAFTAMLATVLGGIAAGGLLAARMLRGPDDRMASLAVVLALTGVAAIGGLAALMYTVANDWNTMGLWPAVLIAILPASILMGIAFPVALGIAAPGGEAGGRGEVGRRIGLLYALNVAGAIAGSLAAGFLLLPWLGSMPTLIALAALFVASGAWLVASTSSRMHWAALAGLVLVFGLVARAMPDPFKVAIDRRYGDVLLEHWRDESAQTAVSVRASRLQHVLYLDGLHQANDQPAMVTLHRAIGHLPMVLHRSPKDVLVVGLGGGATPGAISQYPDTRVQVVELSDGVRRAATFFAHVNYDLLHRPNVNVRIDDGRNFLALTGRRFDVITADVIQPGHAGAGHVYSREYFSLVRRALKEDGLVLQWIGHRPSVEYKMIMRTFLEVFPDTTLWYDANFMVGALKPLTVDPLQLDRIRQNPETRAALDSAGLTGFDVLRSWYTAGPDEMRAFVGAGPMLTDDRPLVEYHHWLPRPDQQPPLDLSLLKGDVERIIRR